MFHEKAIKQQVAAQIVCALGPHSFTATKYMENKKRTDTFVSILCFLDGAGYQTRTGTVLRPRDFKSLASTISPSRHRLPLGRQAIY